MPTKPIPVRLEPDVISRLDRAALRLGTNRAALIKFCAQTFVEQFEAMGGVASLPPNWQDILRSLDGRSRKVIQIAGDHNHHISILRAAEKPPRYKAKRKRK